jgi:hypothetical protein
LNILLLYVIISTMNDSALMRLATERPSVDQAELLRTYESKRESRLSENKLISNVSLGVFAATIAAVGIDQIVDFMSWRLSIAVAGGVGSVSLGAVVGAQLAILQDR